MLIILLSHFLNLFTTSDSTIYDLLIGSYTREGNPGIEVYQFNAVTGATKVEYTLKNPNASYQAVNNNRSFFYSVNEDGPEKSMVSAYQRTAEGKYQLLNTESTSGSGPCYVTFRESIETPTDIPVKPGSGARHLTFNKDGSFAYVISEMSGTVDVFSVSKDHQFKNIQRIIADTTRAESKGSGHIQLSPNGKWLLTSNRVTIDEVTIFSVQADGKLKKAGHQPVTKKPRMFSFDPTGKFVLVAGQEGNTVQVFSFDDQKGTMLDTKQDIRLSMPVCLSFIARDEPIDPEKQLKKLGISLFPPVAPIANYVKFVRVGNLIFLSGHGPDKPEGGQIFGKIGKDLSIEDGQQAARLTGISLISTLKAAVGDLNNVKRIVKVSGFVNSADGFGQQPAVMNGFSNLMVDVFGEKGKHTRTSVGVNALPNNIAVEIEMIVEVY